MGSILYVAGAARTAAEHISMAHGSRFNVSAPVGYSNREIARVLGTAEGTIKNHVSSILAKFGARDRTRAVLNALGTGVLRTLYLSGHDIRK